MKPRICPFCERPLARGQTECPYCGELAPLRPWRRIARTLFPLAGLSLLVASWFLHRVGAEVASVGPRRTFQIAVWSISLVVVFLSEARRMASSPGMSAPLSEVFLPMMKAKYVPVVQFAFRSLAVFLPCVLASHLATPPSPAPARLFAYLSILPYWGAVFVYDLPHAFLVIPLICFLPTLL